jgi:tetratricopeptide (TPR) repeat protein
MNLLGNPEVAARSLLGMSIEPTALRYRQVTTQFATEREVQATGFFPLAIRDELDRFRNIKQLEVDEAKTIEDQVLRPVQEALERMRRYREKRWEFERKYNLSPEQLEEELQPYLHALSLTRDRVGTIANPQFQARDQQYKERCNDFRQTVLLKLQGKSALEEPDLDTLQRFQQGLQIRDADADTIILECLQQTQLPPTVLPDPVDSLPAAEPEPPPSAAAATWIQAIVESELTPGQRRVVERKLTLLRQDPNLSADDRQQIEQALTFLHSFPDEPQVIEAVESEVPEGEQATPATPETSETIERPSRDRRSAQVTDSRRVEQSAAAGVVPWIVGGMLVALLVGGGFAAFNFLRNQQNQQLDPVTAGRLRSEGYFRAQQGNNRQAIESYNQAIQADPTNPATYINRGVSHHRLGELDAALNDYNKALELDPNLAIAYSNRSHVYYDQQKFQEAYNDANNAVQLSAELPEAQINLGNARLKIAPNPNDPTIQNAAIQDYNQVITATPLQPGKAAIAGTNRGNIFLSQNKNPEAFRDYDRAIQLNPEFAEAYFNRAIASQKVGNIPAAIQDYERAAQLYDKQGRKLLADETRQNANQLSERQQQTGANSILGF